MRQLIVLGVVVGAGAVIVATAVAKGTDRPIHSSGRAPGSNVIVITAGDVGRLTAQDVAAIKRSAKLVTAVSPLIVLRTAVVGGSTDWPTDVCGVGASYLSMANWTLVGGVPFDNDDVRAKRTFALLGRTVASKLFPNKDPFGEWIRIGGVPFTVVGVLTSKGRSAAGTDLDDVVLVPFTAAQDRLTGSSAVAEIVTTTAPRTDIEAAEEELRDIVRGVHQIRRGRKDDFTIRYTARGLSHA